jgi:hypothetical protein
VTVNLEVAEGSAGEYTWGIYEFPIDYTQVGGLPILSASALTDEKPS